MFKFIKKFLDKLTEENEKSFGSGRLDCCDLNKSKDVDTNINKK